MSEVLEPLRKDGEYDEEPVLYCRTCLSLKIMNVPSLEDSDYCERCGSTNIGRCCINEWEDMYERVYGKPHLTKRKK